MSGMTNRYETCEDGNHKHDDGIDDEKMNINNASFIFLADNYVDDDNQAHDDDDDDDDYDYDDDDNNPIMTMWVLEVFEVLKLPPVSRRPMKSPSPRCCFER